MKKIFYSSMLVGSLFGQGLLVCSYNAEDSSNNSGPYVDCSSITDSKALEIKLLQAATDGDIHKVQELIESGEVDVNAIDDDNDTPLHKAADNGHVAVCRLLIDAQAYINASNKSYDRPIDKAIKSGHEAVIRFLVKEKSFVATSDERDWTPLHYAASQGNLALCHFWLKENSEFDFKDEDQSDECLNTALLCVAIESGNPDVCQFFIDNGANMQENSFGKAPLHVAAKSGDLALCQLLIDNGASIPEDIMHFVGNAAVYKFFIRQGATIQVKDKDGNTPLHSAVKNNFFEMCKFLIEQGVDINALDNQANTPLHAISNYDLCCLLLDKGAEANAKNNKGETPLHQAASDLYPSICQLLLEKDALIDSVDESGTTALEKIIINLDSCLELGWGGDYEEESIKQALATMEVFIAFKATIPQHLVNNGLVKHALGRQNEITHAPDFKTIAQLLNKNVYAHFNIRKIVTAKRAALLEAVKCNDSNTVKKLLKQGFSLNTCDKDGNTLLHLAIQHFPEEANWDSQEWRAQSVMALLLSLYTKESNVHLWSRKNKQNLTPIEIALLRNTSSKELLRKIININLKK